MRKSYYLDKRQFPHFEDKYFILSIETSYRSFVEKNGRVFKIIHPPEVNLALKINDEEVLATPYRKSNNIEAVVEQNNFTNLTLKTIGYQLNRIEKNIEKEKVLNSELPQIDKNVLFKPMTSEKIDFKIQPQDSSEMVELMNLRCQNLSQFKWYKHVFFSKVYTRKDSQHDFL